MLRPPRSEHSWFYEAWVGLRSHPTRVVAISAALLVPCFWTRRIEAGDLASHLYNAWLVQLIQQGKAPGLWLAHQWTNVLFGDLLGSLFRAFGSWTAEHIAVPVSVLLFFWAAFAFIWTLNRRAPWTLTPCLAMLAYGYVFHAGFFNYYLALGIALILCAIAWHAFPLDWIAFAAGCGAAFLAHPIPVIWAVAFAGYVHLARRSSLRGRWILFAAALVCVLGVREVLNYRFTHIWTVEQLFELTGADQIAVFGRSEWLLAVALLTFWAVAMIRGRPDWAAVLHGVPAQLFFVCAAIIALLPNDILISPARFAWFSAGPPRVSLLSGVLACALVGAVRSRRWHVCAFATLAAVFFAFAFANERELNRLEDEIGALVQRLPPNQRVTAFLLWQPRGEADSHVVYRLETQLERIAPFVEAVPRARVRWTAWHLLDRVCIGHCFSYGNYEPASGEFPVRAASGNSMALASGQDVDAIQRGSYSARVADLPLFLVFRCSDAVQDLCIRPLSAGEVVSARPSGRDDSSKLEQGSTPRGVP